MGRQKSGQQGQFAWKEETMNWEKQRKTGVRNQDIQRNPRAKKETEIRVLDTGHHPEVNLLTCSQISLVQ